MLIDHDLAILSIVVKKIKKMSRYCRKKRALNMHCKIDIYMFEVLNYKD
jgi:hypothetical protein